jgi:PAS domain-containing protein
MRTARTPRRVDFFLPPRYAGKSPQTVHPKTAMHESYLTRLIDDLYDGVYCVNRDGVITSWNESAERITGYRARDVLGRRCSETSCATSTMRERSCARRAARCAPPWRTASCAK